MSLALALALLPEASGAITLAPVTPLIVARQNSATASGAVGGAQITFAYGTVAGNTAVPGCAGSNTGISNPVTLGTVAANAQGVATFTGFVPASVSGVTVRVVAFDATRCDVSNVTLNAFPLVTWANVETIFSGSCDRGCHWQEPPRGASGGLSISGPADLVNVRSDDVSTMDEIEPFSTADSYVWHKVEGTHRTVGGAGVRMPQNGPYLTAQQMDLLEAWILDGALP